MVEILPQEFDLLQDNPTIRTKVPRELLTDDMVLKQVRRMNLSVGDCIRVQCMSPDYERGQGDGEMIGEIEYRLVARRTKIQQQEIDHTRTHQAHVTDYVIERKTEWWIPASGQTQALRRIWNRFDQVHEVLRGEERVFITKDQQEADDIVAGKIPLPEAA